MRAIVESLLTKLSGSEFHTAIGGRIYHERIPQGTALPVCVFDLERERPTAWFTCSIKSIPVRFSIFSDSPSSGEAFTLSSKLTDLLDDCTLSMAGFLSMDRAEQALVPDDEQGIWASHTDYIVQYEEAR